MNMIGQESTWCTYLMSGDNFETGDVSWEIFFIHRHVKTLLMLLFLSSLSPKAQFGTPQNFVDESQKFTQMIRESIPSVGRRSHNRIRSSTKLCLLFVQSPITDANKQAMLILLHPTGAFVAIQHTSR